jgi:hypothetical protein
MKRIEACANNKNIKKIFESIPKFLLRIPRISPEDISVRIAGEPF